MHLIISDLLTRYPKLAICRDEIKNAFEILKTAFADGNKLLIAGNGGSSADAEHIAGELMKSFLRKRDVDESIKRLLFDIYGDDGIVLAGKLEGALPVIPLSSLMSVYTAFSNDVDDEAAFAQMIYGYGKKNDVLLAITTSGNSKNIINATMVARAMGMKIIGLTGKTGGMLNKYCDAVIHAPSDKTHEIQEYHLPVYHSLCAMLEIELFF